MMTYALKEIAEQFETGGDFVSASPINAGHINDTYLVKYNKVRGTRYYILQRINHEVFLDPPCLMRNVERVTTHLLDKALAEGGAHPKRRVLSLISTYDDCPFYEDSEGNTWRCLRYIFDSVSHQQTGCVTQAYQAARAFGAFQRALEDLPGERLEETIPDFHNTPLRYEALKEAVVKDVEGRVAEVEKELLFIEERAGLISLFGDLQAEGKMPERIVHNDTKLNNVLFDEGSGEALCVIDLDTVMPGLALFDFGDLVRTSTSPAAEDERDLSKVVMRLPMFEALAKGYLEAVGGMLEDAEKEHLVVAGRVVTLELGMRFLRDHLQGDRYFKIHRPNHNLDRCRAQFRLIESMEEQADEMQSLVDTLLS